MFFVLWWIFVSLLFLLFKIIVFSVSSFLSLFFFLVLSLFSLRLRRTFGQQLCNSKWFITCNVNEKKKFTMFSSLLFLSSAFLCVSQIFSPFFFFFAVPNKKAVFLFVWFLFPLINFIGYWIFLYFTKLITISFDPHVCLHNLNGRIFFFALS